MKNFGLFLICIAPLAAVAQQIPSSEIVVQPATTATAETFSAADIALIENRARVFRDRLSASGTRYWAVTDRDLVGKSPQAVAAALAPSAITGAVRKVEVVVDVNRPIAVAPEPKKDLNIGTVTLTPAAAMKDTNIQANTYISAPNLRIVRK